MYLLTIYLYKTSIIIVLEGIKMFCCAGLFVGVTVGSVLGGPWTFTAPAIGFGLGLFGDIKLMRGSHGSHEG